MTLNASILERTAAIRIILYLYNNQDRNEGVHLTEVIRNVIASSDTIQLTLDFLLKNGLVIDQRATVYPHKRYFRLTELGLEVAKPLSDADSALRSRTDQAKQNTP